MAKPQRCCFIPENEQAHAARGVPVFGCHKHAEWEIYECPVQAGHEYDGGTPACTQHVGELLTDAPEHRIFPFDT